MTALVIGCGNIGAMYDIDSDEILTHVSGFRDAGIPVTVFDTNIAAVKQVTSTYKDVAVSEEINEHYLSGFTFVSICVPTPEHLTYFKKCIAAKVPVILLEKPVALELHELDDAIALYKNGSSKVLVNYIRRFQPDFVELKRLITSLQQDLQSIYIEYYKGLLNSGSHLFDTIHFLTGKEVMYEEVNLTSFAFDHFKEDPTCSFQFISNHVKYTVNGLENQETPSFKIRMKFKNWELTLDEGCAVAKILNGHKHHIRVDHPNLFDRYLLHDYMKPVISEAITLANDTSQEDNFESAVQLNQQLLQITTQIK